MRILAALFLSCCLTAVAQAGVQSKFVLCENQKFRYDLFVPQADGARPAVLLLHGSGDSPRPMVDAWHGLAKKEGIILIAPELPLRKDFEAIAPRVFHCEVEDARKVAAIDPARIYVFGNSMGGYLAYDALAFESEYFAGVAVHAMGIAPEYDGILDHARRKLPVAIFIGDSDPLVPLPSVRRTRELLERRGFAVHYVELKHHDHNYYDLSSQVNAEAWRFLMAH